MLFQMLAAVAVAAVRRRRNLMKAVIRLQMAAAAIHQIQIRKEAKSSQLSSRRLTSRKHLTSRNRQVRMKDPFIVWMTTKSQPRATAT